jgi:DNA-directed RNA polymerase subunit RPC12/RpoP
MDFKQISAYDNYVSANITLGLLQENEINCHLRDEHIITIDPFLNQAVGGIKLMVAEDDFARAVEIISKADAAYIKEIPCPNCKSLSLFKEEKTNYPKTLWETLKNKIAYGQAATFTKLYKCENCKSIFNKLPLTF